MSAFEPLVAKASLLFEGAGVQVYSWNATSNMLSPALGNDIADADGPTPRPLGVGAAGRAAQTGAPVLIVDYSESVGHATPAGRAGVVAAMGVPMYSDGRLIGAISVGVDHDRTHLGPKQLDALQSLVTGWSMDDQLALLSAIYDVHRRSAFGLAYQLLGDRELAEEAVQDVFLAVWRAGAKHDPEKGSQRTWVLAMVRRRSIDIHRMRARKPVSPMDEGALEMQAATDLSVDAERSIDRAEVYLALETLPSSQREAIELAYFGGLSHTEIAATLHTPIGTIKGRIRLALDSLRRSPGFQLIAQSEPARSRGNP